MVKRNSNFNNFVVSNNFESEDGLPRLPPGASAWRRCRRKLFKLISVSRRIHDSQHCMRSRAAYLAEHARHYKTYSYIIHPFSVFRMYWRVLMFCVWMIVLPCDIYLPAFAIRLSEDGNLFFHKLFLLAFAMNCICNVDVFLNFITGYVNEKHEIVLDWRKILWRYLSSYWIVDMLSFTNLIHYIIVQNGGTDKTIFRLAYCLQFLRLVRLKTALKNMQTITDKCGIDESIYLVIYWSILGLYLIHFNACMLCLVSDAVQSFHDEARMSFTQQLQMIYEDNNRKLYAGELYAHCIFEVLNKYSLNYVYSELEPVEIEDKILAILTIVCALFYTTFMFMKVLYSMNLVYSSSIDYDITKMELQHFMTMYGFPLELQNEYLERHELFYKKEYYNEDALMASFGTAQKIQICMHFYQNFLEKSALFRNLPLWHIATLVKHVKWYFLRAGNEIEVEWRTNITYFVITGTLACYINNDEELCHYHSGDSFGYNSENWRRAQSIKVVALEACELCYLSKTDLHRARDTIIRRSTIFM
ncbi:I[[h]] channel [Carabus blaptoides fortunei]